MALGAVPIATGIVGGALMTAGIALLQVCTQGGSAADAEVPKSFSLLGRKGVAPAAQERLSVAAKDLGRFQLRFSHLLRRSPSEVRIS